MIQYDLNEYPSARRELESWLLEFILPFQPPLDEPNGRPVGYFRCFARESTGFAAMGVHFYPWDAKLPGLLFIDSSGYNIDDCQLQLNESIFPNLQYFFDQMCWWAARRLFPKKNLPDFQHFTLVPDGEMSNAPAWTSIAEAVQFIEPLTRTSTDYAGGSVSHP